MSLLLGEQGQRIQLNEIRIGRRLTAGSLGYSRVTVPFWQLSADQGVIPYAYVEACDSFGRLQLHITLPSSSIETEERDDRRLILQESATKKSLGFADYRRVFSWLRRYHVIILDIKDRQLVEFHVPRWCDHLHATVGAMNYCGKELKIQLSGSPKLGEWTCRRSKLKWLPEVGPMPNTIFDHIFTDSMHKNPASAFDTPPAIDSYRLFADSDVDDQVLEEHREIVLTSAIMYSVTSLL